MTNLAPYVLLHFPVPKIGLGIVVHEQVFSHWEMLSESLTLKVKGKLVRQLRKYTEIVILVTADSKYECFKKFCNYCNMK